MSRDRDALSALFSPRRTLLDAVYGSETTRPCDAASGPLEDHARRGSTATGSPSSWTTWLPRDGTQTDAPATLPPSSRLPGTVNPTRHRRQSERDPMDTTRLKGSGSRRIPRRSSRTSPARCPATSLGLLPHRWRTDRNRTSADPTWATRWRPSLTSSMSSRSA